MSSNRDPAVAGSIIKDVMIFSRCRPVARMPFRLRLFLGHLLGSAAILTSSLALFYIGWYRWPAWYLVGAEVIVGLMVIVDLCAGPIATLVVAAPDKPVAKLRGDMALIIVVQLAALGYGAHALWMGRPLYYAFAVNEIELVQASAIDESDMEIARQRGNQYVPSWHSLPRLVWARLPEDPGELRHLLANTLLEGGDITAMPQYYRPIADAAQSMVAASTPVQALQRVAGLDSSEYQRYLAQVGKQEGALGALPIKGRSRNAAMILDRGTGEIVGYWPVAFTPSGVP